MPAAAPADPTIIVHAGGVRSGNTTTVSPLPNGAVFTATAVGSPTTTATCTTSGGTGTCSISVPVGHQWDVTETTPPPGYYLNPQLDSGTSATVSTFPYAFRTGTLNGTTTVDVPGPANMPDGTFTSNGQTFSQLLATSLNDPAGVTKCGLNIALVLDQSGSMAAGGKQASLVTAANDTITALTGTPSTVAIYTFNQATGASVGKTSTINATSAAPLHNFINALPTPALGTNWDQGLAQVGSGFDEVIFLTDGAPTGSRIRTNNFAQSLFTDTEQGIFSANGIKAGGTRIVGVGIGIGTGTPPSGGTENLRAVSGPTQNQDFFLGTNTNFGAILKALATGACNNQLTITKQIQDPSGALISPTPADANGWAFTNTISSGSTIASPVTTAVANGPVNGVASAAVTIPAGATPTVTVTETLTGGYTFVSAQCSVGGVAIVPTPVTGTTATFTGAAAQPMACTFTNKRLPATISTTPSAGGPVGTSISDTATVAGGVNPTGNVTFQLFAPGNTTCAAPPVFVSTNRPLSGTPPSATSTSFTTTAVGTYHWLATYNGDANNAAVTSGCTAEPVNTIKATPTIATTPSAGGPVGTSIFDTATVSGGFNPTGSVTFKLFGPADPTCTGTPLSTSTNPLSGGSATSNPFSTVVVGIYHWVGTYNGDANNNTVSSACAAEPVAIIKDTPTIATTPSAGGPVGTSIFDTATVSGGFNPTGTVTFELFPPSDADCSGTPIFTSTNPLSGGSATSAPPVVTAAVGTYHWGVIYSGDANNTMVTLVSPACQDEPVTIDQATPSIATSPSAGGPVGTAISDTATVSGGFNPTGNVTFKLFGPANPTCTGTPLSTSTNPLSGTPPSATSDPFSTAVVGIYHWTATYNGDTNNAAVSSDCAAEPVDIGQATPTIATTASAGGPVGTSISDTATVSGGFNPAGNVTFVLYGPDDATCSGAPAFVVVNVLTGGSATTSPTFSTVAVGTYQWVATYNGNPNNAAVSSVCGDEPVVVTQATPTIATTPSAGGPVGTSIFDTATLDGGVNPTGTVTFELFGPANPTCTGMPVFTSNVPVAVRQVVVTSGSFTPVTAGTYQWVATYNGDDNNATVSSACADEPVDLGVASSAVITTAPSAGGPVGTAISDTATVSGGFNPMGTVTFDLFGPANPTCTGTPLSTSTNPLSGTPPRATSDPFSTTVVGIYHWVAIYNGDANNAAVRSDCAAEPVDITQATPTIATSASAGGPVGTSISDTATLSGGFNPTGNVTFVLYGPDDATCSGAPAFVVVNPLIGGSATTNPTFSSVAVGTYQWVAIYNGTPNNMQVSSVCGDEPVDITQAIPTIATSASAGGPVGTSISDTATVSGGFNPTGTVTFDLFGPANPTCTGTPLSTSTNPLSGGSASSDPFSTVVVGTYHWVAIYNGDDNNTTVSSVCGAEPVDITQATPTIATSASAGGPVGTAISDTATVSGGFNPAGNVTFVLYGPDDATCSGAPAFVVVNPLIGGSATSDPFSTVAVGTYQWVATYNGTSNNAMVSSVCGDEPVDITQAIPTIATSASAGGPVGTSISDTATVSGGFNPTGTVTFDLFGPANPTCTGIPLSTSTNPLSGGSASSDPFSTVVVGTYHWVAIYNGDDNNAAVSSVCGAEPVDITQAIPTIATSASAGGPVGTAISDTATVSGGFNPAGNVTFVLYGPDDATCSGAPAFVVVNPLIGGSATSNPTFSTVAVGTYQWVATYNGTSNNAMVSSVCGDEPVDITQAAPTIATMASAGGPVGTSILDTATVSGGFNPTGTVTFVLFGPASSTCTGTPLSTSTNPLNGGSAGSDPFSTVVGGTYHWVATYNGDANNAAVSSLCAAEPVDIGQATPTISTTASAGGPVGTAISDTATVSGGFNPTGNVTFVLFAPGDATCSQTAVFASTNALSGGSATSAPFPTTAVGTYHWIAIYNGNANNTTVSSLCADEPVVITQATPTIATAPSAGGPVGTSISDTATVSGGFSPTGTVTFELFPPEDSNCTGSPVFTSADNPLSGGSAASAPPFTTVAVGTHQWVATYNGDTNNTTVSSGCSAEPVDIGQAPQPMVTKTVTSNTQNPDGTWTIVYDVAVTNPNASIETSFTLTDTLAFGPNIDVNSAKVTGAGASPSWNGATDTTIVAAAPLDPGATEHYTVTVNATVLGRRHRE